MNSKLKGSFRKIRKLACRQNYRYEEHKIRTEIKFKGKLRESIIYLSEMSIDHLCTCKRNPHYFMIISFLSSLHQHSGFDFWCNWYARIQLAIPKVRYSKGMKRGSLFRRFVIPKVRYSEVLLFRRFVIPKIRYSVDWLFWRFVNPKWKRVNYSKGSFIQKWKRVHHYSDGRFVNPKIKKWFVIIQTKPFE